MEKIVVITGASSGIGKDLKDLYLSNFNKVITISRTVFKDDIMHYTADVSNENEIQKIFEDIKKRFGRIDILINNAGYGLSGATELLDSSLVEKQMNVNFLGVFYAIKYAISLMHKGSKIINISSAMALFPLPFRAIYSSSKVAVLNLTYSLRMENSPYGIDFIAICPGDVKTNFTKNREKVFATNEKFGKRIENATNNIDKNNNKRMPSIYVAKKIFKITKKHKTKPFYIIGPKYKFLYFISKFFPKSWLLHFTNKFLGGKIEKK